MKILAFAYACEPGSGSEPGAGWIWSRMLAQLGTTYVITRENNRALIEAGLAGLPDSDRQPVFLYVDLPPWARTWKKGNRGVRAYYLLWQIAALRKARELKRRHRFDAVWHLTFANAWFGTGAASAGGKFFYGPVGAGVPTPWGLSSTFGFRGFAYEVLRSSARTAARYLNPLARIAWRRAAVILVQNRDTREWFPKRYRGKVRVFPHVVLDESFPLSRHESAGTEPFNALFLGRLIHWKGGELALRAVANAKAWTLTLCGDGPDLSRLRRLADDIGVADRVRFKPAVPRSDVSVLMDEADVFLFPSLHDEAGWVVVEAMTHGLPVLCLDLGGPAEIVGSAGVVVPSRGGKKRVAQRLASELEGRRFPEPAAIVARAREFRFDARVKDLERVVADVIAE